MSLERVRLGGKWYLVVWSGEAFVMNAQRRAPVAVLQRVADREEFLVYKAGNDDWKPAQAVRESEAKPEFGPLPLKWRPA
jgi:hypothetical protein